MQLRTHTCQSVDLVLLGARLINIRHKPGQASDAVAAHLWLGAVGVVDAHGEVCGPNGRQGKDHLGGGGGARDLRRELADTMLRMDNWTGLTMVPHPVTTDAKVTITQLGSLHTVVHMSLECVG